MLLRFRGKGNCLFLGLTNGVAIRAGELTDSEDMFSSSRQRRKVKKAPISDAPPLHNGACRYLLGPHLIVGWHRNYKIFIQQGMVKLQAIRPVLHTVVLWWAIFTTKNIQAVVNPGSPETCSKGRFHGSSSCPWCLWLTPSAWSNCHPGHWQFYVLWQPLLEDPQIGVQLVVTYWAPLSAWAVGDFIGDSS